MRWAPLNRTSAHGFGLLRRSPEINQQTKPAFRKISPRLTEHCGSSLVHAICVAVSNTSNNMDCRCINGKVTTTACLRFVQHERHYQCNFDQRIQNNGMIHTKIVSWNFIIIIIIIILNPQYSKNCVVTSFCSSSGRASVSRVIQKLRGAILAVMRERSSFAASSERFSPYSLWNSRYFPMNDERATFSHCNADQCFYFLIMTRLYKKWAYAFVRSPSVWSNVSVTVHLLAEWPVVSMCVTAVSQLYVFF